MATDQKIAAIRRLKVAGRFADCEREIERALDTNGSLSKVERASMLYELSDVGSKIGAWHRAQSAIDEALELLGPDAEAEHGPLWTTLMERRAWIYFRQNRLRDARLTALKVLPQLELDDANAAVLGSLYNTLGGIAYQEGRSVDGIRATERSIEYYERAGNPSGLATARTNLGVLLLTEGKWTEAAEQFAESDRQRRDLPDQTGRSSNLLNLGLLELSLGEHDIARDHLEESLNMSEETGEDYVAAHAQLALAYLALLEARVDEADQYLDAAMARDERMCGDDRV